LTFSVRGFCQERLTIQPCCSIEGLDIILLRLISFLLYFIILSLPHIPFLLNHCLLRLFHMLFICCIFLVQSILLSSLLLFLFLFVSCIHILHSSFSFLLILKLLEGEIVQILNFFSCMFFSSFSGFQIALKCLAHNTSWSC